MKSIPPELQEKINKAKAEIQKLKQDNEWGGLCIATQILVARGFKEDARTLIQGYLKQHQR